MGRDVAGLSFDKRPSVVNVKSNGTNHGVVHVSPEASPEKVEVKDYETDDHNQDVVDAESTNHEPEEKIIRADTDYPGVKCSPQSNDQHSYMTNKKSLPNTPSMSEKPQHFHNEETCDEEDNCSLAFSNTTSVQTNKFKVTVPVAPRFTVEERLERRKEYYSKLEEKHKALEKEKLEHEARTKEEEQAAIKLLRKSMVYKANPIPSFYREGPPPKVELKKLPVTRAKSPKLARRKSCGDVKTSPADAGVHERAAHQSVGENPVITSKGKDRNQAKDHPQEQEDADNAVES